MVEPVSYSRIGSNPIFFNMHEPVFILINDFIGSNTTLMRSLTSHLLELYISQTLNTGHVKIINCPKQQWIPHYNIWANLNNLDNELVFRKNLTTCNYPNDISQYLTLQLNNKTKILEGVLSDWGYFEFRNIPTWVKDHETIIQVFMSLDFVGELASREISLPFGDYKITNSDIIQSSDQLKNTTDLYKQFSMDVKRDLLMNDIPKSYLESRDFELLI